jgi:hypothetical protein
MVMAQEPGLSDLILATFLLRHSILTRLGTGLVLAVQLVFARLQATGATAADGLPGRETD